MKFLNFIFSIIFITRAKADLSTKCSKTLVCGVGSCCRGPDNKVIPASLHYFTDVDWWRAQIGVNPGNCTNDLAREGEQCDSFCLCQDGFLCTPNILCRNCGNICMSAEFVSKLVRYYDLGCNCIGPHGNLGGPTGINGIVYPQNFGVNGLGIGINQHGPVIPPLTNLNHNPSFNYNYIPNRLNRNGVNGTQTEQPLTVSEASNDSNIKIVNNIVQLPGVGGGLAGGGK